MHSVHETLSENLLTGIPDLPEEKLFQTAIDGPNFNWKVLEIIQKKQDTLHLQILGHVVCMWSVAHFTQL